MQDLHTLTRCTRLDIQKAWRHRHTFQEDTSLLPFSRFEKNLKDWVDGPLDPASPEAANNVALMVSLMARRFSPERLVGMKQEAGQLTLKFHCKGRHGNRIFRLPLSTEEIAQIVKSPKPMSQTIKFTDTRIQHGMFAPRSSGPLVV